MPVTQEQRDDFQNKLKLLPPLKQALLDFFVNNSEELFQKYNVDNPRLQAPVITELLGKNAEIEDKGEIFNNYIEHINTKYSGDIEKLIDTINKNTKQSFEIPANDLLRNDPIRYNQIATPKIKTLEQQKFEAMLRETATNAEFTPLNPLNFELSTSSIIQVQNIPEPKNVKVPNQSKESATEVSRTETKLGEFQSKLSEFMKDKDLAKMIDINSDPIKKLSEIYDFNKEHKPNFLKAIKDGREIESLCKKAGLGSSGELHKDARDFIKAICLGKEPNQSVSQGRS